MALRTPEVPINPTLLIWARETMRLTLSDAANLIGVDAELLTAWENGTRMPSFAQLKTIGGAYKRATAVFLLPRPPEEAPTPKDYRVLDDKKESKLSPSTFIEIRKAQKKRDYALELLRISGQTSPTFDWKVSLKDDPETAGRSWRKRLGVDDQKTTAQWKDEYEALNFWKSGMEALGVLIFQASLENLDEMRGLAVYHRTLPMILLNTKDAPRGRIFSLLHEFCHLLLQRSGIGNMEPSFNRKDEFNAIEVFCNAFAAGCLLPMEKFLAEPVIAAMKSKQPDFALLNFISRRYQVSWEVVLRRLLSANRISSSTYNATREEMREFFTKKKTDAGGFADYITKTVSYNGEPYISLVLENFKAGNISVSEASDFLGVKANHFDKIQNQVRANRKRRA